MTFRPLIALLIFAASYPCAAADADKPEAGAAPPPTGSARSPMKKSEAARKAMEAIKGTPGEKAKAGGAASAPPGGTSRPAQEPPSGSR